MAESTVTPSVIINTQGTGRGGDGGMDAYRTLGLALGVTGILYYANKYYQKYKNKKSDQQYGSDPASQTAVAFRNAFNPSGFSWLIDMDTTNTDAVLSLVSKIKSKAEWDAIVAAYNKNYNESIVNRVNGELSQDELKRFNEILLAVTTGKAIPATDAQKTNGTVTTNWIGKRVKMTLSPKSREIVYWMNESDIGKEGKGIKFTINANAVHVSRNSRTWICKNRKKVTLTVGGTTWPVYVPGTTINMEVVQLEYPGSDGKKYMAWFNATNFEIF